MRIHPFAVFVIQGIFDAEPPASMLITFDAGRVPKPRPFVAPSPRRQDFSFIQAGPAAAAVKRGKASRFWVMGVPASRAETIAGLAAMPPRTEIAVFFGRGCVVVESLAALAAGPSRAGLLK